MFKKIPCISLILIISGLLYAGDTGIDDAAYARKKLAIAEKYRGMRPKIFSTGTPGVKLRINTTEKIMALTLDACGGGKGSGFDRELIDLLKRSKIPATLFMTGLWIDANPVTAKELASDPLFEIENHGLRHRPASVKGARIYGRTGTADPGELVDELELNSAKIERLSGRRPVFYRSGTAYYDDVAVRIICDLGYKPVNFSILSGDAEKRKSSEYIEKKILRSAKNGAIIIAHMNQPGGHLYPALKRALPVLTARGYRFVKLEEYRDSLR